MNPIFTSIEPLESRIAPAGLNFHQIASGLDTKLAAIQTGVDSTVLVASAIPVVGAEITNAAKLFDSFAAQLHTALDGLAAGATNVQIQDAIFGILSPLSLLAENDGVQGINASDVVISRTAPPGMNGAYIDIDLHLHHDTTLVAGEQTFNLGLKSVPFDVSGTGGVDVTFGFDYQHLNFGFSEGTGFFLDSAALNELTLDLQASVHAGSSITATLGFLGATLTDGSSSDASKHTHLGAGFLVDIKNNGASPTFAFTGGADIYLKADAAFDGNFPGIGADFELHWWGPGKDAAAPTVAFKNVRVDLGSAISGILEPIVSTLDSVLKPVQPVVDFLTAPIPILSDLSKAIGSGNISLLDVAGVVKGKLPEEYKQIITLASTVAEILKLAGDFKADMNTGNVSVLVGDFIAVAQSDSGADLRGVQSAMHVANALTSKDLSSLVADGFPVGFDINTKIDDAVAGTPLEGSALITDLKSTLDQLIHPNGISYSFPFFKDPGAAVFGLLLGRDANLFTLDATLKVEGNFSESFPIALGFSVGFGGHASADLQLHIGYDTFGLRELISETANHTLTPEGAVLDFLDGIYMTADTHIHLDAGIAANAGFDIGFASVSVEGGVTLGVHLDPPGVGDLIDADHDDSKIHFRKELKDCLFITSGSLDAYLDVVAKVGIGPLSISKHFGLAEVTLLNFGGGCIPNPFTPPVDLHLASTHSDDSTIADGTLRLNIGAFKSERGVSENVTAEDYQVFVGGNPNQVVVVAFGYAQTFDNITQVVGDGGEGADTILFQSLNEAAPFTANVLISGGDGNDQITYHGTGAATIFGGLGDDVLTGGDGINYINGGDGNDQLTGGASTNHLGAFTLRGQAYTENGDDNLLGGNGLNLLDGGDGNDELFAGITNGDVLIGGKGNDQLMANLGSSSFQGGSGDDRILWRAGDGKPILIDGGSDFREDNSLELTGSDFNDVFTLSKNGADSRLAVAFEMPGTKFTFLAKSIHNVLIEGGAGADQLTVNSLTATAVHDVGLNLSDVLKAKLQIGDGMVDVIRVAGRSVADTTQIEAEQVAIQFPLRADPVYGGVMKVTGLPEYTVRLANVADDFTYNSLGGNDSTTLLSNTGPTRLLGGEGDDAFTITAKEIGDPLDPANPVNPKDYLALVNLDAGLGKNSILFNESASVLADTIMLGQSQYASKLVPSVNFIATGGSFKGGVALNAGPLSDTITLLDSAPGVSTTILGGAGDDTLNVGSSMSGNTGSLSAIGDTLNIDLGSGAGNKLRLTDFGDANGNHAVLINPALILGLAGAADSVAVNYAATGGALALTIDGSNTVMTETFTINSPNAVLTLNANAGSDVINVNALTKPLNVFGGAGDDLLNAGLAAHKLSGLLAPFAFHGEGGIDALVLNDQSGAAAGAFGIDAASISFGASAAVFDATLENARVFAGTAANAFTVVDSPVLTGVLSLDGGPGVNKLTGANSSNIWNLGADSGTLNGNIVFDKFAKLAGGTGDDRFIFSQGKVISGTIGGGPGQNTLDYSSYTIGVIANLLVGNATSVTGGIGEIQHAIGGSGADILVGNTLKNTLRGGAGRDLLIGGASADSLDGGDGDDILIAGTTDHDGTPSALIALLSEWNGSHDYATRAANLRAGGGANGAVRLFSGTVHDDFVADTLKGGGGMDWFHARIDASAASDSTDLKVPELNG